MYNFSFRLLFLLVLALSPSWIKAQVHLLTQIIDNSGSYSATFSEFEKFGTPFFAGGFLAEPPNSAPNANNGKVKVFLGSSELEVYGAAPGDLFGRQIAVDPATTSAAIAAPGAANGNGVVYVLPSIFDLIASPQTFFQNPNLKTFTGAGSPQNPPAYGRQIRMWTEQIGGQPRKVLAVSGDNGKLLLFDRGQPSYSSPFLTLTGSSDFGTSIDTADINSDGFTDLIVGDPGATNSGGFCEGKVYVFLGPFANQSFPANPAYTISNPAPINATTYPYAPQQPGSCRFGEKVIARTVRTGAASRRSFIAVGDPMWDNPSATGANVGNEGRAVLYELIANQFSQIDSYEVFSYDAQGGKALAFTAGFNPSGYVNNLALHVGSVDASVIYGFRIIDPNLSLGAWAAYAAAPPDHDLGRELTTISTLFAFNQGTQVEELSGQAFNLTGGSGPVNYANIYSGPPTASPDATAVVEPYPLNNPLQACSNISGGTTSLTMDAPQVGIQPTFTAIAPDNAAYNASGVYFQLACGIGGFNWTIPGGGQCQASLHSIELSQLIPLTRVTTPNNNSHLEARGAYAGFQLAADVVGVELVCVGVFVNVSNNQILSVTEHKKIRGGY